MSKLVQHLRWLCNPDAERIADFERINQFVAAGLEAADELERLRGQIDLLVADIHRYRDDNVRLRRTAGEA